MSPSDAPKRQVIDLNFYKDIPIVDICDLLGIEISRGDRFCCPAHNDTNPSAKLYPDSNTWHCFTCGAGGSNLDLVMAATGCKNAYDAARFLGRFYPEGISEETDYDAPPFVTRDLLLEIGLKENPYHKVRYKTDALPGSEELQLSRLSATQLLIRKITEAQIECDKYAREIFTKFPGLPEEAQKLIRSKTRDRVAKLKEAKEPFLEYEDKLIKRNCKSFVDELEKEEELEK